MSTVCGSGVGLFFSLIDDTVIFAVFSLIFPALSSARIVNENSFDCVPVGSFSTSCFPALNLIEFVVLSYSKKSGNPVTLTDLIPLPFALSSALTSIFGKVLSKAVISQFVLSAGDWIVGFVTSLTFNGIVTSFIVPSLKVTVALIIWSP